jgi:hypothetical protein
VTAWAIDAALAQFAALGSANAPLDYEIKVKTSDKFGAGTDANVVITLNGTSGSTREFKLDGPGNDFESGSLGTYTVSADRDAGEITSVRIRHDNSGPAAGWHLAWIEVKNKTTGKTWKFNANTWLAKDEGDKKIDRVLTR